MGKANLRWSWDHRGVGSAALRALYDAAGFDFAAPVGNGDVAGMFGPGVFGLFAFSDDALIGSARAFSDDLATTWLAEICVVPLWRERGVGRSLLGRIDGRFRRTALYCDAIPETVDFFKAGGLRPKMKLIACRRPPSGRKAGRGDVPGIVIHDEASRHKAADFDHVYDSVGFGMSDKGMPRDILYRKSFGEGIFGSFADSKDGRLVGLVRAFSDDLTKCYVAEICVHPAWQRQGIGRALVERMVHRFSHTIIHAEAFPESVRLFESCGVAPIPGLVGCSRAPHAD